LESTEGLEIIPIEIRNQGTKSIVQYILDLCKSPNSNPLYRTKLMAVGFENVGKTTIAGGSYDNSLGSDILYSFVPQSGRGSSIHIEPNYPIYVPVNEVMYINRIQMRITDQLGRRVNFNGEPVTYFLHIRKSI